MTDIIERLDGPQWYSMKAADQDALRQEAAAEIERLRSALYAIVGQLDNAEDALNVVYRECEEALGDEDTD